MTSVPYHGAVAQPFAVGGATTAREAQWLLPMFMMLALIPLSLNLVGLRLTPLRVMLLVLFVPFLLRILRGQAGRFTSIDLFMLFHAIWIMVALAAVHGTQKIPFAGITMVEMVGGYLMGRVLIRNADDYRRMVRLLLGALMFLFPFAVIELLTGRIVIAEIIDIAFDSVRRGESAYGRMGLERVYAVFDHPILFGIFCSIALANLYYLAESKGLLRWAGMALAGFMTFASLSSAPLLACALQGGMIIWDKITRGAWKLFVILFVVGYVTVDALSNRTPITILIETLTFNAGTGWTRIAIYEFGIQNAIEHPIFGIGFNDWERPHWLTESVDNFWLLTTMRFGFVGSGVLIAAFVLHLIAVIRAKLDAPDLKQLRVGYLIAFIATCFSMVTAHLWGAVGVFVMFYLGAGGWMYTTMQDDVVTPDAAPAADTSQSATSFSRFTHHSAGSPFARTTVNDKPTVSAPRAAPQTPVNRPAKGTALPYARDLGTAPFSRKG